MFLVTALVLIGLSDYATCLHNPLNKNTVVQTAWGSHILAIIESVSGILLTEKLNLCGLCCYTIIVCLIIAVYMIWKMRSYLGGKKKKMFIQHFLTFYWKLVQLNKKKSINLFLFVAVYAYSFYVIVTPGKSNPVDKCPSLNTCFPSRPLEALMAETRRM